MMYFILLMDLMWIGCTSSSNELGWIINGDLHYFYSNKSDLGTMKQPDARNNCLAFGADLLSIINQNESDFVTKDISTGFWLGLYTKKPCGDCATASDKDCTACRNRWEWYDGTPYEFQNWQHDRPSKSVTCSRLFNTGEWRDQDCTNYYSFICKRKGYCSPSPCQNGECKVVYTEEKYNCSCHEGYTGRNCTEDINECVSEPCANNATCRNDIGNFNCVCAEGWSGTTCQLDIDECHESHVDEYCEHGVCTNFDGGYSCDCFEGYYGDKCKQLIHEDDQDLTSLWICLYVTATLAVISFIVMVIMLVNDRYEVKQQKREESPYAEIDDSACRNSAKTESTATF